MWTQKRLLWCGRHLVLTSDVYNCISRVTGGQQKKSRLRSCFELQIPNLLLATPYSPFAGSEHEKLKTCDYCTIFNWIDKKRRNRNGETDFTNDKHGDVPTSKTCSRVSDEQSVARERELLSQH